MLKGGNPLTVGVGIVIEVIRKNNSDYDPEHLGGPESMPTPYDPIYLGSLLRLFARHIPHFMALIKSSKHAVHDGTQLKSVDRGSLNSAWGGKIEPLGFDRFKTCELMAELLHCSNMGLLNESGSDDYVRERNVEREKLIREGFFNPSRNDHSGMEYNETTADFTNGSTMDTGSPEALRPHAGEEEGFEDVGASGVLVGEKPEDKEQAEVSGQTSELDSESNSTGQTKTETPASPGGVLADQVSDIKLATETQNEEQVSTPVDQKDPISPKPEDVPPPLFSPKKQSAEPVSQPAEQEEVPPASEPAQESERVNDGSAEDPAEQYIQYDTDGQPVVGDYLKIMFVENKVVPTILVSH
jgi:SIT4-associating protein SAP185/190